MANWLVGREIIEEEQKGSKRAEYGKELVEELAKRLQADYGNGYAAINLWLFRCFYQGYSNLGGGQILYATRKESGEPAISDAVRRK